MSNLSSPLKRYTDTDYSKSYNGYRSYASTHSSLYSDQNKLSYKSNVNSSFYTSPHRSYGDLDRSLPPLDSSTKRTDITRSPIKYTSNSYYGYNSSYSTFQTSPITSLSRKKSSSHSDLSLGFSELRTSDTYYPRSPGLTRSRHDFDGTSRISHASNQTDIYNVYGKKKSSTNGYGLPCSAVPEPVSSLAKPTSRFTYSYDKNGESSGKEVLIANMSSPHSIFLESLSGTPSPEQVQDSSPQSPTLPMSPMLEEQEEPSLEPSTSQATTSHGPSQTMQPRKRSRKNDAPSKPSKKSSKKLRYSGYSIDPTDFSSEDVIQLVQERPSLWDKEHPKHSDNVYNRKIWDQVYIGLFPDFLKYGSKLQEAIMELVQKRWRSVRDSYFKHLRDTNLPSGSGAKKSAYKHADRLSFLHKIQELRTTTSNTGVQKATTDVEEVQIERQQGEESASQTEANVTSGLRFKLSQRHISRKNRDSQRENLIIEAIQKLDDLCASKFLHIDVRLLRLEGLVTGPGPSPNRDFLMTLLPSLDRMSEEQLSNYKARLIKMTHDFLNPPQGPVYPSSSPSVHQHQRPRQFPTPFSSQMRYEESFEVEEGQVYRRM